MDELVPSDRITKEDVDAANRKAEESEAAWHQAGERFDKDREELEAIRLAFIRQEHVLTPDQVEILEMASRDGFYEDYGDADDVDILEVLKYIEECDGVPADVRVMDITEAGVEALNRAKAP